jgi:redox-sensing transcriptional repressor
VSRNDGPVPIPESALSRAAALRLSQYLRTLAASPDGATLSSDDLADAVGVGAAQVRRDLLALGHLGQRGVGYDKGALASAIRHALGLDRTWRAVLVGVGNLARALLNYRGFQDQGFLFVGLFDSDPQKIGQSIEGLTIEPVHLMPLRVQQYQADLGILAVPSEAAQLVADQLVQSGIKGILNFAPTTLKTPNTVQNMTVDLAIQLEQLAFLVQNREPSNL